MLQCREKNSVYKFAVSFFSAFYPNGIDSLPSDSCCFLGFKTQVKVFSIIPRISISAAKVTDNLNPRCQGYMGVKLSCAWIFQVRLKSQLPCATTDGGGENPLGQVLLKQGIAAGCGRQSPSSNEPCMQACTGALPCCRAAPPGVVLLQLQHYLIWCHLITSPCTAQHSTAQAWPLPSRGRTPHTSQSLPPQASLTKLSQPCKPCRCWRTVSWVGVSSDSWWLSGWLCSLRDRLEATLGSLPGRSTQLPTFGSGQEACLSVVISGFS